MFMLMPFLGHYTMQKQGSTRDVVGPIGSSGFEVVLILLTKAVPVQMRITIIEVREPGFQWLLSKFCLNYSRKQSLILVFQVNFYQILQQFISRRQSKS